MAANQKLACLLGALKPCVADGTERLDVVNLLDEDSSREGDEDIARSSPLRRSAVRIRIRHHYRSPLFCRTPSSVLWVLSRVTVIVTSLMLSYPVYI